MLSLLIENVVGIHFNACLRENFTKYLLSSNECRQFRQLLLLNFLFRLNYYFLRRINFLNKRLSHQVLFKYTSSAARFLIKFTGVFVMLIYIMLSLWAEPQSVITMGCMIVVIVLVCGITYARVRYDDELIFQKTTQNYFKLLLTLHIVLTIFLYTIKIVLFYIINKFEEETYNRILNNKVFAANLKRNRLYTKEDFLFYVIQNSDVNFNIEAVKTILLVLSTLVINNSGMFVNKDTSKKLNIQYIIVIIFSLFFVFYALTMYYMINIPEPSKVLLTIKFIFVALVLIFVVMIIYKFYKISKVYNFKMIIEQEIYIFRSVFVKDIHTRYFNNSLCESDYFNEKYYFLKKIYRSTFVDNIKVTLLGSVFDFLKICFACFIVFWIVSLLYHNLISYEKVYMLKLVLELSNIFVLFILIYLLTIAIGDSTRTKSFKNPSKLLLEINTIIIEILKTKDVSKFENELKDVDTKLDIFMEDNLDVIVKRYRPEFYNQLITDIDDKLAKMNENYDNNRNLDISKGSDHFDKEFELTDIPQLVQAKSLYQLYKPQQKLRNYEYQRLNASHSKKMINLPINRLLLLKVVFLYSAYDILKEVILNLFMLFIVFNVNGISLVLAFIVLGANLIIKLRFWRLLTFMCLSIMIRTLCIFYFDRSTQNILKLYLKIFMQNSAAFNMEFCIVGLSIFLFVPTFLLIKTIFSDFGKIRTELNKKDIAYKSRKGDRKVININYYNWTQQGVNWLTYLHRFLILKERYIIPSLFFGIVMCDKTRHLYFELYIVYTLLYFSIIQPRAEDQVSYQKVKKKVYMIFKFIVFVYYIGLLCWILFGDLYNFDKDFIFLIFILKSKVIMNDSSFCEFEKQQIKQADNLHKELCVYLVNIDNNEKLILQKIMQQIKYYKILKFKKYSAKDQFFSLNNITKTNLTYFGSNFSKSYLLQYFFNIHFKSFTMYWEDLFCLLLMLESKYSSITGLNLNINELLTFKYDSGIDMIRKINTLRHMIHNKHIDVVTRFVDKLKVLECETEENLDDQTFDELDIKNFEDCETPEQLKERLQPVFARFIINNNTVSNYHPSEIRNKLSSTHDVHINNFKYNHIIDKDGKPNIDFTSFIKAIYSLIDRKSDKFIFFLMIYMLLFHYGVLSFCLIPFILFFIIMDKSDEHKVYKLKVLYFMIFIVAMFKHIIASIFIINRDNTIYLLLNFIMGDVNNLRPDYTISFMLFSLINICSNRWNRHYLQKKEFPAEAAYRIALNNDLNTLDNHFNFDEGALLDYFCPQVNNNTFNHKKASYLNSMQIYLKEILELKSKIKSNSAKVLETLKLFNSHHNYIKFNNFLWRNFSYQNINYGRDHLKYKIYIILAFIFRCGYYFFVYKRRYTYDNFKNISDEKSLDGTFVLMLTFGLAIIIYDIIFYNYQSIRWSRSTQTCNTLTVYTNTVRKTELSLKKKFVSRVKYIMWIQHFMANAYKTVKPSKDYMYNTYTKKFIVNIVIIVFMMVLCLFWLPSFDEDLIKYSLNRLIRSSINFEIRILLFWVTLYILIDILDSNIDKINNYDSILNTNFKSKINAYVFKIYIAIPFIMEIKALLSFISSKTALNILKWYRLEDIKRVLINAKFANEGMKRKLVGVPEPWYMRLIFAYGFFLLFYLILVAPFFIFSSLNPLSTNQVIKAAEFSIMFKTVENNIDQSPIKLAEITQFKVDDADLTEFNRERKPGYNLKDFSTTNKLQIDIRNTILFNKVKKIEAKVNASKLYDYNREGFKELKNKPIHIQFELRITVS